MRFRKGKIEFSIDPDWKPEIHKPSFELSSYTSAPKNLESAEILSPATAAGNLYQGVMAIIEIEPASPSFKSRYVIILDTDKELMRFPFGQLEVSDSSNAKGAERETDEEVGIQLSFDTENYIGTLNFRDSVFHIFTKKVSTSTPIILGKEQEAYGTPTAEIIDAWIKEGKITFKHAKSWKLFKQKRGLL